MLQRLAPSLFRERSGETVTIAAIATNNNGVESAVFRFGAAVLPTRIVQGHPGCDFVVRAGSEMFGTVVIFAPNAPGARYDLFEEDDNGNLADLQVTVDSQFGALTQFQIDGVSVARFAAARKKKVKAGGKKKAKKTLKRKTASVRKPRTTRKRRATKASVKRGSTGKRQKARTAGTRRRRRR